MAKLKALVFAAVWLIVALAMIVLVTPPSPVGATLHDWFSKSNPIDDIKKKPAAERSSKEWQKLTKDCLKVCTKDSIEIGESDMEYFSKLDLFRKDDCDRHFAEKLLGRLIHTEKKYPPCFGTIREYFSLYLDFCGHTGQFKKVLEVTQSIKQDSVDPLSFADDQTLDEYLIDSLVPKISGYIGSEAQELSGIISAIEEISGFASNREAIQCSRGPEIDGPFSSEVHRPNLHRFRKLYFKLYLDKCGFEEAFKKMGGNINQIPHDSLYTTLYSSLERKLRIKLPLGSVLSAIRRLSALESISEETLCTEKLRSELLEWLIQSKHDYFELYEFFSGYLALYLDKCGLEQFFNERIEHIRQGSDQHWNLVEFSTLHSYLVQELWKSGKRGVSWIMSVIKRLSDMERMSKEKACTSHRKFSLLQGIVKSDQFEDFSLITADHFAVYLEKCGYEEIVKRRIEHMGADGGWNLDDFPTLHSYLMATIWQQGEFVVSRIMAVVKNLSRLEGMSKEAACTDQYGAFVLENVFENVFEVVHEDEYGNVYENPLSTPFSAITADFFSLYLEKCGLEESFKKRVDSIDSNLDKKSNSFDYSTLHSLIRSEIWDQDELAPVLALMKKLSKLDGTPEEIDCSEKIKRDLLEWLNENEDEGSLRELMENYQALYLNKCGFGESATGEVTEV